MANPFAGGTERNKLFAWSQTNKNLTDKAATIFAENMHGRGYFDVSGALAVPNLNLAKASAAAPGHGAR